MSTKKKANNAAYGGSLGMTCSAGSMLRCYDEFLDFFPWKKSEFPTYDLWICSDADDARIFRQGWAARCKAEVDLLKMSDSLIELLAAMRERFAGGPQNFRLLNATKRVESLMND